MSFLSAHSSLPLKSNKAFLLTKCATHWSFFFLCKLNKLLCKLNYTILAILGSQIPCTGKRLWILDAHIHTRPFL